MRRITRREFLLRCAAAAVLLGLGRRRLPGGRAAPAQARAADGPRVAVARGTNDDTSAAILKTALDGLGGIQRFVHPGQTVAIKVNATWAYPPGTASSSDPTLIQDLVRLVQAAGAARIIVLDHCSIDPGTAECLRVSGIGKAVAEMGVESLFPNLTDGPRSLFVPVDFPQGKSFQSLRVMQAAVEADVRINLALAKSHNVTKMTLCLKHMMGLLEAPGLLHAALEQGIADINTPSAVQAHLHILEAIRVRLPLGNYRVCAGPETELTAPKIVRRVNQIAAGVDPALIDAYASQEYYAVRPEELNYLVRAHESGVGDIDVDAARADGRLVLLTAGAPIPTAAPPPDATETAAGACAPAPTATPGPLPTPTPEPGGAAAAATPAPAGGEVVDPGRYLNGALLPAALIAAGAGLAALRRANHDEEDEDGDGA